MNNNFIIFLPSNCPKRKISQICSFKTNIKYQILIYELKKKNSHLLNYYFLRIDIIKYSKWYIKWSSNLIHFTCWIWLSYNKCIIMLYIGPSSILIASTSFALSRSASNNIFFVKQVFAILYPLNLYKNILPLFFFINFFWDIGVY